jgi:hypothetical protein
LACVCIAQNTWACGAVAAVVGRCGAAAWQGAVTPLGSPVSLALREGDRLRFPILLGRPAGRPQPRSRRSGCARSDAAQRVRLRPVGSPAAREGLSALMCVL